MVIEICVSHGYNSGREGRLQRTGAQLGVPVGRAGKVPTPRSETVIAVRLLYLTASQRKKTPARV